MSWNLPTKKNSLASLKSSKHIVKKFQSCTNSENTGESNTLQLLRKQIPEYKVSEIKTSFMNSEENPQ